jgi:glycosyltransferase involved in cell wall biosynthesis
MASPLVSCIMITGKHPGRRPLALAAIQSYFNQLYAPMELLIINDGEKSLGPFQVVKHRHISEVMVEKQPTLGHLRNIGLELMLGDYWTQWDDDDFSHVDRVKLQLDASIKHGCPVTLESQIRCSLINGNAYVHRQRPRPGYAVGIPGTIFCPRTKLKYLEEAKHEDTHFAQQFEKLHIMHNSPTLYIRFHHENSTWHARHVMGPLENGHGVNKLGPVHRKYLNEVLEKYYRPEAVVAE